MAETSYIDRVQLPGLSTQKIIYDYRLGTTLSNSSEGAALDNGDTLSTSNTKIPTSKVVSDAITKAIGEIEKFKIIVCEATASKIPAGATYYDGTNRVTGTMAADTADDYAIYFVKNYDLGAGACTEWISIKVSETAPTHKWEMLGTTVVDLSSCVKYTDNTNSSPVSGGSHTHTVKTHPGTTFYEHKSAALTPSTTFSFNSGSVTVNDYSATKEYIKASAPTITPTATIDVYPSVEGTGAKAVVDSVTPTTKYLHKTSVRGVKTGTGSTTTASKANADSSITYAIRNDHPTNVVYTVGVDEGILSFTAGTVYGCSSTGTTTKWTFTNVDVPIVADSDSSFFSSVITTQSSGDEAIVTNVASTKNHSPISGVQFSGTAQKAIKTAEASAPAISKSTTGDVQVVTDITATPGAKTVTGSVSASGSSNFVDNVQSSGGTGYTSISVICNNPGLELNTSTVDLGSHSHGFTQPTEE